MRPSPVLLATFAAALQGSVACAGGAQDGLEAAPEIQRDKVPRWHSLGIPLKRKVAFGLQAEDKCVWADLGSASC